MEWMQAIGAFFIGGVLFRGRMTASTAPVSLVAPEAVEPQMADSDKKIYLNCTNEYAKPVLTPPAVPVKEEAPETNIVVMGAQNNDQDLFTKKMTNGNLMMVKPRGSYVIANDEGQIVKTRDSLGVIREFMTDVDTGELMVRRFGVWTTPPNAALSEEGVLSWGDESQAFEEHLDGTFIHKNLITGTTIVMDKLNGTETVTRKGGQSWRQSTTDAGEELNIWENGDLKFHSFSYREGGEKEARTMLGPVVLRNVLRYEAKYEGIDITNETFSFKGNAQGLLGRMRLELPTGALFLKNVASIECQFTAEGDPQGTIFKMDVPTTFSVDIPGQKAAIADVTQVSCKSINDSEALTFITSQLDEYVVFLPAKNSIKQNDVFNMIRKNQESGMAIPDLWIR